MADTKTKRTYLYAVGRRKTAVARVRLLKKGDGEITVNDKPVADYFPATLLKDIKSPLSHYGDAKTISISAKVQGGGKAAQAIAMRLGIARLLLTIDESLRKNLRTAGFLTRDSRKKERKKPGLKRARRAPQWSKR
ncbi:MAG: 30S ribosomal protein S9 [Patescibacteria group bacterium]